MRSALVFLAATACSGHDPRDAPPADPFDPDLAARLLEALEHARLSIDAPGATLAVSLPDEGTWVGASGVADKESGLSMDPDERFRIGSVTKTFVATVALQLHEEGAWSIDEPVGRWVPDLPAHVAAFTLRQLLNHTSGLVDIDEQIDLIAHFSEAWTPAEIVAASIEDPPLFAPGTRYSYSNINYMLLGLAIEGVASPTLGPQIRTRLLDPLGLDDTFLEGEEAITGSMSRGYIGGNDATDAMEPVWGWAAGHMISDADDLVRWSQALLGGEVLAPDTLAMMTGPTELPSGDWSPYGLGVDLHDRGGGPAAGHTGSTMGFQSDMYCRPDGRVCVVSLCNDFLSEATDIARAAWAAIGEAERR